MNELTTIVWIFVIISIIEFFIILFLCFGIKYYQNESEKNWKAYIEKLKQYEELKTIYWRYYYD